MAPSTVQITVSTWIVRQVDCSKYIHSHTPKLNVSCLIMIDRYELTTELGNDMVCDGWGVIPCISLLRMTVVTCLGCGNHVSLNRRVRNLFRLLLYLWNHQGRQWYKNMSYKHISYWNIIRNIFVVTEENIWTSKIWLEKLSSIVAVVLSISWKPWNNQKLPICLQSIFWFCGVWNRIINWFWQIQR